MDAESKQTFTFFAACATAFRSGLRLSPWANRGDVRDRLACGRAIFERLTDGHPSRKDGAEEDEPDRPEDEGAA
jgi:hypothetical protein